MSDRKRPGRPLTRREFLEATAISAVAIGGPVGAAARQDATVTAVAPRRRAAATFVRNGRPLVVVVEGTDPAKMIEAGLDALGGLKALVGGKGVVIKPNIVATEPFPVTSDLQVSLALARRLRADGAGAITVCDSPNRNGAQRLQPFERNGWFKACADAGIRAISVDHTTGDYRPVRHQTWECCPEIRADQVLFEAPVLINQPTLKRHFLPGMTCVFKNYLGAVVRSDRRRLHDEAEKGNVTLFKKAIAEFADSLRSELAIVDARSLLIKGGPGLTAANATVKSGVNRMILGGDMVAVEAYAVKVLHEQDDTFSPAMADDTLAWAEHLGLGTADLKKVEIVEKTVA